MRELAFNRVGWLPFLNTYIVMVIYELNSIIQTVSESLGIIIPSESYKIILREKPHNPCSLPIGKMAVYMFRYGEQILKIGKVGPKSNARFQNQHYNPNSAQSNLAKSIINDENMVSIIGKTPIDKWIKNNCDRIDIIIDEKSVPEFTLELIEAILHYKYRPKYEGNRY